MRYSLIDQIIAVGLKDEIKICRPIDISVKVEKLVVAVPYNFFSPLVQVQNYKGQW